jgi:hypothetical protein
MGSRGVCWARLLLGQRKGEEITGGGYSKKSKRWRTPLRGETLDLTKDFVPKQREWWKGGDLTIPFAKLYIGRHRNSA